MGHVFISYARPDEPLAQLIAEELRRAGFEVWRDDELPAHRAYAEVIEERINGARAVVVLWSSEAAKSHWVRAEADTAIDEYRQAGDYANSSRYARDLERAVYVIDARLQSIRAPEIEAVDTAAAETLPNEQ